MMEQLFIGMSNFFFTVHCDLLCLLTTQQTLTVLRVLNGFKRLYTMVRTERETLAKQYCNSLLPDHISKQSTISHCYMGTSFHTLYQYSLNATNLLCNSLA
jgi:hypothetical protein